MIQCPLFLFQTRLPRIVFTSNKKNTKNQWYMKIKTNLELSNGLPPMKHFFIVFSLTFWKFWASMEVIEYFLGETMYIFLHYKKNSFLSTNKLLSYALDRIYEPLCMPSWYHSNYHNEWFILFQIRGRIVVLWDRIHRELGHTKDLIVIRLS